METGLEAFVKVAIGLRQMSRIDTAISRMSNTRKTELSKRLMPKRFSKEEFMRQPEKAFVAHMQDPQSPWDSATQELFHPVQKTYMASGIQDPPRLADMRQGSKPLAQQPWVKEMASRRAGLPSAEEITKVLVSGRHTPKDIVKLPWTDDPNSARAVPGVNPERWAYRGSKNNLPPKTNGATWVSGLPTVAAGYARDRAAGPSYVDARLRAYDATKLPNTPWTPHIQVDPETLRPRELRNLIKNPNLDVAGVGGNSHSTVGASPIYERVVRGRHLEPAQVAEYKPLPTEGMWQKVRGRVNPLAQTE